MKSNSAANENGATSRGYITVKWCFTPIKELENCGKLMPDLRDLIRESLFILDPKIVQEVKVIEVTWT